MAPKTGVFRLQGDEVLLCRYKLAEHSPVNISWGKCAVEP